MRFEQLGPAADVAASSPGADVKSMQRPGLHWDMRATAGGGCLFERRAELGLERAALDVAQQVLEVQLVPRDVLHLLRKRDNRSIPSAPDAPVPLQQKRKRRGR